MDRRHILLIVEDDEPMRKMLAVALGSAGYEVEQAANGREGLVKAAQRQYGCLLVDVMMPLVDGLEMIRELKLNEKQEMPQIIMMSNLNKEPLQEEAENLGIQAFLDKTSLSVEEIVKKVDEVMNSEAES
jgi:two-component system chemotaxis response regulator CheY